MNSKLRVGVVFGGRSGEHEVSLMSASTIIETLDRDKYEVVPIGITKDGEWLLSGDPLRELKETAPADRATAPVATGREATRTLIPVVGTEVSLQQALDVVIPVLHGPYGEDGTVQGLFELAQIPYVGAGVLASAVGMDKAVMKDVFRQHGIPVVASVVVKRKAWRRQPDEVLAEIEEGIGYPCFIKPANLGSSVGISKAHDRGELPAALDKASEYDRKIVVEQAVENCREIEVSVLGNDDAMASLPGEIVPCHEFYDYAAKYIAEGSRLIIPAALPAETAREVQRLAVAAFQAVDCAGMARVDCFVTRDSGQIYVNEINTIPGFTRISMYPKLWEASGIGIGELLDRLIALAMERHEDKKASRTSYR